VSGRGETSREERVREGERDEGEKLFRVEV